jgi:hypothetical protein
MPRIPRGQQAGFVYHVINRGNGRATIIHKPQEDLRSGLLLMQIIIHRLNRGFIRLGLVAAKTKPLITIAD